MVSWANKYVPYGTLFLANINMMLLVTIIVLIPFSLRHVLPTNINFQTGAYSDFSSISLYISDLLLITFIWLNFRKNKIQKWHYFLIFFVFWTILEVIFNTQGFKALSVYFTIRLLALLVFCYSLSNWKLTTIHKEVFAWAFTILGLIQSLLALFQFIFQRSIGLYALGESHLSADAYGIAKIVAHGTKYVRGYGTFPHSNLLAAFLFFAIILNLYLFTKYYQKSTVYILSVSLVINIFGLLVTFSRAGIIAGVLGVGILAFALALNRDVKLLARILSIVVLSLGAGIAILAPYLLTRATITDNAVKERLFYNEIGEKIVRANPILGTGLGISVLHMEQYSPIKLQPWEIQPIHNYYLLSYAEWGIGSLILILFIIFTVWNVIKKTFTNAFGEDLYWNVSLSTIGIGILLLFFFDHYFYTIWPTQLLLWFYLGITRSTLSLKGNVQVPR